MAVTLSDDENLQQLILLGLSLSSIADTHILKALYAANRPKTNAKIHSALRQAHHVANNLQPTSFSLQADQIRQNLLALVSIPYPGQADNETRLPHDPILDTLQDIRGQAHDWTVQILASAPENHYINNPQATATLAKDIHSYFPTKSACNSFLRNLGQRPTSARFILNLVDTLSLDRPYFPYDWAKALYYALGYHIQTPHLDIFTARRLTWKYLIAADQSFDAED